MRVDIRHVFRIFFVMSIMIPIWIVFNGSKGVVIWVFGLSVVVLFATIGVLHGGFYLDSLEEDRLLYDVLPLRRRVVMISHYLISAVCVIVVEFVAVAVLFAVKFMGVKIIDNWWVTVFVSAGIIFSISAIMVPVLLRFGGGIGATVMVVGLSVVLLGGAIVEALMPPMSGWGHVWWSCLFVVCSLVFYAVSLPVSIRFYERQDH